MKTFFFAVALFRARMDGMKKRWVRLVAGAVCGLLALGCWLLRDWNMLNETGWRDLAVFVFLWFISVCGVSYFLWDVIWGFTTGWNLPNFVSYLSFTISWMMFFEAYHCVVWLARQFRDRGKQERERWWKFVLAVLFVLFMGVLMLDGTLGFVLRFLYA